MPERKHHSDTISDFGFKWEVGKYFIGQDVKGDCIPAKDGIYDLPNSKLFKPSINVFSIHDLFIS